MSSLNAGYSAFSDDGDGDSDGEEGAGAVSSLQGTAPVRGSQGARSPGAAAAEDCLVPWGARPQSALTLVFWSVLRTAGSRTPHTADALFAAAQRLVSGLLVA